MELQIPTQEFINHIIGNAPVERDRTTFIGGSDAAAILGVSPWKTPVDLYLEKLGINAPEPISPAKARAFKRGKRLEPVVLEMVADKLEEMGHDVQVIETNKIYKDEEYPFLECEIDAEFIVDGEHINSDMKTVHGFAASEWGEEGTDQMPVYYAAQFMHGLSITKRNKCLVAALIGYDDVAVYWLHRDDETIQAMRDKSVKFWLEHVQKQIPPDPKVFEDIKHLFPIDRGSEIEATNELVMAVSTLRSVKAQKKALEAEEKALKFAIASYIGEDAILTFDNKPIATYKTQPANTFREAEFKADYPELAKQYTTPGTNRVLRLTKA